jgi:hypothetical protein
MRAFLTVLVGILLAATLGILLWGAIGMARGVDPRTSNKLMQWRVVFQASALLLLVILMSMLHSG